MRCTNLTYRPDFEVLKGGFAKRLTPEKSVLNACSCSYYILDAQGNQLLTFEHVVEDEESNYQLSERVIYGSSRLGMNTSKVDMLDDEPQEYISLELGNKLYEMSNHLGNVLTVINDIKIPVSSNSVDIDGYLATIVSTADYSPFGVQLDGRTVSASSYRWGFNGQEKDDEIYGEGNSTTAEFWQYDSRLGRRWNLDPVVKEFESPYATFANNPIWFSDPNGADTVKVYSDKIDANGKQQGQDGFDANNMLLLYTTYVENGQQGTRHMGSTEFNNNYQTVAENVTSTYNQKDYAKFISANTESPYFSMAVKTISLADLNSARNKAVKFLKGRKYTSDDWLKYQYFNHGAEFDIKAKGKLLDGYRTVYIEGVGIVSADFVGNLYYGAVWSSFQDLNRTLYDGDYLQNSGGDCPYNQSDDPYDSYALMLGHMYGRDGITKSTFKTKVQMKKKVFTTSDSASGLGYYLLVNDYEFKYGTWSKSTQTKFRKRR